MSSAKFKHKQGERSQGRDRFREVVNILESLITAFIGALFFITFVMQTFVIPTGSMANTLKGAHFRLRCPQCGYPYDHGFVPEKFHLPSNTVPHQNVVVPPTRCPVCGYRNPQDRTAPIIRGDKILVLKCIYQFLEPKRWDVVVFKNPTNPKQDYIKRLIGKPHETIEIIDGDVYIDGKIGRKPEKVQNQLWMPVYNSDYQPALPNQGRFNGGRWKQPFQNAKGSKWKQSGANPTAFYLDCPAENKSMMIYDSDTGRDFTMNYAYNDVRGYSDKPFCSDLMVRFYVNSGRQKGGVYILLSKYGVQYRGRVDFSGRLSIERTDIDGRHEMLASEDIPSLVVDEPAMIKFENVDHLLMLTCGKERLVFSLKLDVDGAGEIKPNIRPEVAVAGWGELVVEHLAIFRDIYYTSSLGNGPQSGIGTRGNAIPLGEGEFFVLGDNSPASKDSRWWEHKGIGNKGIRYRRGIVPREFFVGKAMIVFWPGGYKPYPGFPLAIIPNTGRIRLIYGGSTDAGR